MNYGQDRVYRAIKSLPQCIPLPEEGQDVEDENCQWIFLVNATIEEVSIAATRGAANFTPDAVTVLKFWVEKALTKAPPTANFFVTLGVTTQH